MAIGRFFRNRFTSVMIQWWALLGLIVGSVFIIAPYCSPGPVNGGRITFEPMAGRRRVCASQYRPTRTGLAFRLCALAKPRCAGANSTSFPY